MAESTSIARGTTISGRIEGQSDLSVEGRVEGTISVTETLTIALEGRVSGDVQARQVIIEGSFDGDIQAEERVVLSSTARAVADISAPIVEMADGAQLRGELTIGAGQAPSTTSSARTATPSRTTATRSTASTAAASGATTKVVPPVDSGATTKVVPPPVDSGARTAPVSGKAATTTVVQDPLASESAQEEAEVTEEDLEELREDYTVKELREELRRRDLMVSGTKDELIERLLQAQDEETA